MDAKKNSMETCPLCGNRKRKPSCMVCLVCKTKVIDPINEANAKAALNGRLEDMVDIFEFVVIEGGKMLEKKKEELANVAGRLANHKRELRTQAEHYVASILSSLSKGNDRRAYRSAKSSQSSMVDQKTEELERNSKVIKSHYALTKIVPSLKSHIDGLRVKHEEFLAEEVEVEGSQAVA